MGTLLTTEGKTCGIQPSIKHFTLNQLQALVGGYIEMHLLDNGDTLVMNEEGRINGMPVNPIASKLYGHHFGEKELFGNVLVLKEGEVE